MRFMELYALVLSFITVLQINMVHVVEEPVKGGGIYAVMVTIM